ncbi:hypothetical protein DFH09DRAFT_1271000 [Mycena vulgaris]|nr:hypothetical protein DFH09DRAFT_1271000 [Mycena vulgaris]
MAQTPVFFEVNFQGENSVNLWYGVGPSSCWIGTGINVRCIIANNKADPSILSGTGTKADYSFIDAVPQNQDYTHEADTTGDAFLYNTFVEHGEYLVFLNGGQGVDGSALMLFDYAIVTYDRSDDGTGDGGTTSAPTTTSPVGPNAKPSATSSSQSTTIRPRSSITAGGVSQTQGSAASANTASSTSSTSISATPAQSTTQSPPARSSSSSPIPSSAPHKSSLGAIIGGLGGGLLALFLLLFFWLRRRRLNHLPNTHILPFPRANAHYSRPYTFLRSFVSRKTREVEPGPSFSSLPQKHNPNRPAQPPSSPPAPTSSQSNPDAAIQDVVRTLRAEVELLREQQREMVAMVSTPAPPPAYEEV